MTSWDNRYVLEPIGSQSTLWVQLVWKNYDADFPCILPDGRNWEDILVEEGISGLPQDIWLEATRVGRRVDWLWTGGLSAKIVSQDFIDIVKELNVTEIEYRALTIKDKSSRNVDGYYLFNASYTTDNIPIRLFAPYHPYTWSLDVNDEVAKALTAAKLTGFRVTSAWDAVQEIDKKG